MQPPRAKVCGAIAGAGDGDGRTARGERMGFAGPVMGLGGISHGVGEVRARGFEP